MSKIVRIGRKAYKVNLDRFEEFMTTITVLALGFGTIAWFMTHAWWG